MGLGQTFLSMKKEILFHLTFFIVFFILVSLFREWLNLNYWPFWFGGLLGIFFPDIDNLIYVYFFRPFESTSQKVSNMLRKGEVLTAIKLLSATRRERTKLIFHTLSFQMIFIIFAFLVITSSGSILGRGFVLGFLLHLSINQIIDLLENSSLSSWFKETPQVFVGSMNWLDDKKNAFLYSFGLLIMVLVFGFLL